MGLRLAPSIVTPENRAASFAARTHQRNKHTPGDKYDLRTLRPATSSHPFETLKQPAFTEVWPRLRLPASRDVVRVPE